MMVLSQNFSVDTADPSVIAHNREIKLVMDAYRDDKPERVPLLCGEWAGQHGFYMEEEGLDYRAYYHDPDEMVRVQLEAARRRRELGFFDDLPVGVPPDTWPVSVDFWPVVAPAAFGCELIARQHAVIAHHSLNLPKDECREIIYPDVFMSDIFQKIGSFYDYMQNSCAGRVSFLGKQIGSVDHGVGTNGLFSLALDIRGADIMADMHEDPAFVHAFLEKLAGWIDRLETAWDVRAGHDVRPFMFTDHGIDMLSADCYMEFLAPVVQRHNLLRGKMPGTALHHCGRGSHLFPAIKAAFGFQILHAATYPLLDIARVRRELGEDVWIVAMLDTSILQFGKPDDVWNMAKNLLTPEVKGKGRFSMMIGDMLRGVPMENMAVLREAVKAYGRY